MKKNFKTIRIGKKLIPATAALGILFSVAPVAENKASAGLATVLDVTITSLGIVADVYEKLGISVGEPDLSNYTGPYAENVSYRAPNFKSGEFNISVHHTKGDSNFTRTIKVLYPDGKSEMKDLKSGQQLKITEPGTIVDLKPFAESVSEHDLLYITQAQLDEGKTGVALNQVITVYVEKTSGENKVLVDEFYKKKFGADSLDGFKGLGVDRFSYLTDEQKKVATLTSHPVGREVLSNYVTNNPTAQADFNNRSSNVFAEITNTLDTPITLPESILNHGEPYKIIPYKKGSNKVLVKAGSKYLSGKEGKALQYSDSIGNDELFELVQTHNSSKNKFQFYLINKNGVRLAGNSYGHGFDTDFSYKSEISFTAKGNDEVNNWLIDWYPGKEHEKQKYERVEFRNNDKSDNSIWTAYDSSGKLITNSWVNRSNSYYYTDASGVLLKGWKEIKGNTYYFNPESNSMALPSTSDALIEGKLYHFNNSGVLQRSAWDGTSYSDATGAYIQDGLQEIEGEIYYFKDSEVNKNELRLEDQHAILHFSDKGVLERASDLNGKALASTTVTLNGKQLVFEKDGSVRKPGLTGKRSFPQSDGTEKVTMHYYSLEDGASYSGWKVINGKNYHFQDGKHYTFNGHETIDGKKYYFNHDGQALLTGFKKDNGKIYHFDDKGVIQTGWQEIDGKWYYFDDSGAAKVGWFNVGGGYHFPYFGYFTYYAKEDGSIYQNVTVKLDNGNGVMKTYKFDSHGHKGY
ncbi:N-acetylmuramoyl-L-alanine amidase family protein [Bacillus gaemokensis]|uniref:Cell wall-binding protein n=1 Tax=Bacillus gaemokensis TaxID=574375 RepID=A0A073K550_9BACI|nr:cell wall-binding protein [Bacillus gaemokensis]KEK21676.1 cell wall-binding protein [Bacillus gaemokensis]KYG32923.1 cell wall-binding protein [Bacillus gaemokensis]